jgi:hypothetical protein
MVMKKLGPAFIKGLTRKEVGALFAAKGRFKGKKPVVTFRKEDIQHPPVEDPDDLPESADVSKPELVC